VQLVNTLLMIIGFHAVILGFALVIAGIGVIASPTEAESEAFNRGIQAARQKSWWHAQLFALQNMPWNRFIAFALLIERWPERPLGRKLVYFGILFLAIAAGVGYHFEVFTQ
jgi:uncharacterized membrane protein